MNDMTRLTKSLCAALLAAGLMASGGCAGAGWLANAVDIEPPTDVTAEYRGLDNQTVAVLVDADLNVQFQHPTLVLDVTTLVSNKLATNVPGITVIDAKQVVDFQNRNIYWNTTPYRSLAKRLGVTRLVMIDVVEFRLHERGNVNVFKGYLNAGLGVAEADGATPNDLTYSSSMAAAYPPSQRLGAVNADQRLIRLGTITLFCEGVSLKFYDHRVEPVE